MFGSADSSKFPECNQNHGEAGIYILGGFMWKRMNTRRTGRANWRTSDT